VSIRALGARIPLLLLAVVAMDRPLDAHARAVRYAQIDPRVVRLEVTDGHDIRFSRLSHTSGVSQTRVAAIVQDKRGFMWFATQYGLNRYDGYTLKRFRHVDSDPRSISDSLVQHLLIDHAGRLWVGSQRVVDRYDPATESFIHYPLGAPALSDAAAPPYHPNYISEGPDGKLWVATGFGLYRLDPLTGATTGFHHRAHDPTSLSSDFIEWTGTDRRGTLWVATPKGLEAFDPKSNRVTFRVSLHEPREMSFYEDRSGNFWIIHSSGYGLALLNRDTGVLTQFSFLAHRPHPDELSGVSSMIEDGSGQLWVGTQSDGLLKLDAGRRQAIRYRNDPFNPQSLAENRITALARDREGEIWVGLGASAPNHFSPRGDPFHALPFDAGNRDNLGEHLVNVLYEDHEGTLWVGTTGALNRYDRTRNRYEPIPLPGRKSDVLAIVEDGSGALWVGTSGAGLARLDPKAHSWRVYRHRSGDASSLSSDTVIRLLIDHSGTLWAATYDGLDRYDPLTNRFHTYRFGHKGFSIYTSVAEDAHRTLWISGPEGLLHFDPATGKFLEFKPGMSARGYGVLAASDGEIWAGTPTGLYRFNPATHTSRVYTDADGLASSAVACMLEDATGAIWMSTTEGVSRLIPSTGQIRNYSVADGLPGRDMTGWSACFRGADGEMYFGGFAGAVAFDPRAVVEDPYTPPVVLTGLELAGNPVQPGPGSVLTRAIGYTRSLHLSSDQRSFSIEFAALGFRSPSTNRYRFRMEGLDSSWHTVSSDRRIASYTTLAPGSYTFQVQAATNRGPWGLPGASLRVTIDAPWWDRWEFRALLAAVALALVCSLYLYRVRRITRALEIRFDERIRERTRIARDLHDSLLQGIQGLTLKFHALAHTMPEGSHTRISMERSLRQARELIEEVRTRVRELRTQDEPRGALEELLRECSDHLPKSSDTACEISVVGQPRPLDPVAFEEVLRVGREAISNAITHAGAAQIEAELTYRDRELTLKVSDDGKGMDANTLEAGRAGHWGLKGMRERAGSLRAVLELWSRPGGGTVVQLVVPASVAYAHRRPGNESRIRRIIRMIVTNR
jgi:ligand-binding sensor domain-containing protein/signal transduction histidine kinase